MSFVVISGQQEMLGYGDLSGNLSLIVCYYKESQCCSSPFHLEMRHVLTYRERGDESTSSFNIHMNGGQDNPDGRKETFLVGSPRGRYSN